jgi:hypothetical protein
MKLRNLTQQALRKTSTVLLKAEHKLEPTAKDDLIALLKTADIPTPVLLTTLNYLHTQLAELADAADTENDNA